LGQEEDSIDYSLYYPTDFTPVLRVKGPPRLRVLKSQL